MKLNNESEFYEQIFSLSYTDLLFPLFVLISLHRTNLIDIQKIETNSSLVIIYQTVFQTWRGPSLCDIWSELLPTTKKGLANSHNLYTFSHKVIILNPACKYIVKGNDRNIRNRLTMCSKSPSEMFDWVLNTLVNLNNTLKNLKIVLLHLQKYRLSGSLVFYT